MQPAAKKNVLLDQLAPQISNSRLAKSAQASILQQLFMSLHWDPMPEGLIKEGQINATYPMQKAWDSLSLLEKIAALFRAHGFHKCCSAFPKLGNVQEELELFQKRVHALTNGLVSAPQLSHYAVMRTLLLADKEKLDGFPDLYRVLENLFTACDNAILNPQRLDDLKNLASSIQGCISRLHQAKNHCLAKPNHKRLERAIGTLQLFLKATEAPVAFVPVLLSPVQAQDVALASMNICLEQIEHLNMDPAAADWLADFYDVFKKRFTACQQLLEKPRVDKQRELFSAISSIQQKIFQQAEAVNKELTGAMRDIHRFQELSRIEQRQKEKMAQFQALIEKVSRFPALFHEHHAKMGEWKLKVQEYLETFPSSPITTSIRQQYVEYPWRFYASLLAGITSSLVNQPAFMRAAQQHLDALLPAAYSAVDTPYATGIDVLDCCFRTAYFAFRQQVADGALCKTLLGDQKRKILSHLDGLMATSVALFKRPRAFLAAKRVSILAYEDKKGSYELMEASLSNKLAWDKLKNVALLDAKAKKAIESFSTYFDHLAVLFTINSWPALVRLGGSASRGENSLQKEAQFFHEHFCNIRRSIIHYEIAMVSGYLKELLSRPGLKLKGNDPLTLCTMEIFEAVQDFQQQIRSQPEPDMGNSKAAIGNFLTHLADFLQGYDERRIRITQILNDHIEDHPDIFEEAEKFLEDLEALTVYWDALFISPSRPLIRYHLMLSLMDTERNRKAEQEKEKGVLEIPEDSAEETHPSPELPPRRIEPAVMPKQLAPKQLPPKQLSNDLPELMVELEAVLQSALHLYKGFKVHSDKSGAQFNTQFQEGAAMGLLHTLKCLRELAQNVNTYGERPAFSQELHLRVAVLLEQAVKLAASENHVSVAFEEKWPLLLVKTGRQCLWQQHAPERIFKILHKHIVEKKGASICLNEDEMAYMKNLERMIAITSRYPASGSDSLAKLLSALIKLKNLPSAVSRSVSAKHRQNAHQFIKDGLKICLKLLSGLKQEHPETRELVPERVQAAFSSMLQDLPSLQNEAKRISINILARLEKIRLLRMIPEQRQLIPLAENEETEGSRKGTIETALHNLKVVAQFSQDLLTGNLDPALCLTHCHSVLRQEAVLLEMAQLLLLAHAPLAAPETDRHILWADKFPLRYSHRLDYFAENLFHAFHLLKMESDFSLCQAVLDRSRDLTLYLKEYYRYHSEQDHHPISAQIQKMETLSELWERLITGRLTPKEEQLLDRSLDNSNPQERQERLSRFIRSSMVQVFNLPLLRSLKRVDQLLAVYENLLN